MTHSTYLSEKWIKASILGTIWASSEIVLGSFLHNLRVPFSGNILTAIGQVILISASYKWKESGLFWRAGIICALLKTMSPSAVIFGPMVAIVSEAFLLEFSVRVLGKTIPAFILGAVLAMSWNLIQKIFNYIIFYGYNIVEVYTNLMEFAQKQLRLQFDVVWAPLILLLVIYALFGAFSALIGIKTGRKLTNPLAISANENYTEAANFFQKKGVSAFDYSIFWLMLDVIFMIAPLLLIGKIRFGFWVILIVAISTAWALRYKRALRQLVRPKLWIFFVIITMITAFVFTRLQSENMRTFEAILIGVEMNLRAILLIMGFSVLGTELYHPKIRNFLSNSYFKQLPLALELSLESLPAMISSVPDFKSIVRNPVQVIYRMMEHADEKIEQIKNKIKIKSKVIIVTGEIGAGKTTCLQEIAGELKANNRKVAGVLTQRLMQDGKTIGYNIVDILTGNFSPLLRTEGNINQGKIGKYFIDETGVESGRNALQSVDNAEIVIIDEIGWLEHSGGGWAQQLELLFKKDSSLFILSVRKEIVDEMVQKWDLKPITIFNINEVNAQNIKNKISNYIKVISENKN